MLRTFVGIIEMNLHIINFKILFSGEKLLTHSVDVTALLSIFYINVRANRQNRRTFLSSLLKIFSEENSDVS